MSSTNIFILHKHFSIKYEFNRIDILTAIVVTKLHTKNQRVLKCKIYFKVETNTFLCLLVTQSCTTLCNSMDCSPPGSSVHGFLQARILEWVSISYEIHLYIDEKKKFYLINKVEAFLKQRKKLIHYGYSLWSSREIRKER